MQNEVPSLEDVKSHFDHWRATRPKRCKTPSFLWDKVRPLIGHYSLTSITQALRINSDQIKQHVQPVCRAFLISVQNQRDSVQKKLNLDCATIKQS